MGPVLEGVWRWGSDVRVYPPEDKPQEPSAFFKTRSLIGLELGD